MLKGKVFKTFCLLTVLPRINLDVSTSILWTFIVFLTLKRPLPSDHKQNTPGRFIRIFRSQNATAIYNYVNDTKKIGTENRRHSERTFHYILIKPTFIEHSS